MLMTMLLEFVISTLIFISGYISFKFFKKTGRIYSQIVKLHTIRRSPYIVSSISEISFLAWSLNWTISLAYFNKIAADWVISTFFVVRSNNFVFNSSSKPFICAVIVG